MATNPDYEGAFEALDQIDQQIRANGYAGAEGSGLHLLLSTLASQLLGIPRQAFEAPAEDGRPAKPGPPGAVSASASAAKR